MRHHAWLMNSYLFELFPVAPLVTAQQVPLSSFLSDGLIFCIPYALLCYALSSVSVKESPVCCQSFSY